MKKANEAGIDSSDYSYCDDLEYENEDNCRVCKRNSMTDIIDLGNHPLANSYVKEPSTIQKKYPVCLTRCHHCSHTQLNITLKPEILYKHYLYSSGTSHTMIDYFKEFAKMCIADSTSCSNKIVLEIACNDGSQLNEFKAFGWKTYGIDPAKNLTDIAKQQHTIHCGYWDIGILNECMFPIPDVIIAQNVLAHVKDPITFLLACYQSMNEDTTLYIQTSQSNMYINGEFDAIYHEHMSYFTIKSMLQAAETCNLVVINITRPPVHGISYLFHIKKMSKQYQTHGVHAIEEYEREKRIGLYDDCIYNLFKEKILDNKSWLKNRIIDIKSKGYKVVGYGAAAKAMGMLSYFEIHHDDISYIIDDSPLKHGLYSPGTYIRIYPSSQLSEDSNDNSVTPSPLCILLLAWNFKEEIIDKIKKMKLRSNVYILKLFPDRQYYELLSH